MKKPIFPALLVFVVLAFGCSSPLIIAAEKNDVAEIRRLAASGANVNEPVDSTTPYTPLMIAALEGNLDAVKTLLELGANPTVRDAKGRNASSLALDDGHVEVHKLLLEAEQKWIAEHGTQNLKPLAPTTEPPALRMLPSVPR